jgi:16S rRNA (uracil1498-N3)-methyltransferase
VNRFHVPPPWGEQILFSTAQAHQLSRVLRLQIGDRLQVFDGAGVEADVELTLVTPKLAQGNPIALRRANWNAPWRPVLYLGAIRPQRFEWAIEKATELGVSRIVPLLTSRTTHAGVELSPTRLSRWRQIAVEAAEQCGATYVPAIEQPCSLSQALAPSTMARVFAWEGEGQVSPLAEIMESMVRLPRSGLSEVAFFIGPEGGFDALEVNAARQAGCLIATLGERILRSETAAIAVLATLALTGNVATPKRE